MGNVFFVSLRLAVALVCVGVSLIMGGQWMGLIPDGERISVRARAQRCEAIAIQSALLIRSEQWDELEVVLKTIVMRNEDMESIGVTTSGGEFLVDTGAHLNHWDVSSVKPGIDGIHVPITVRRQPWGEIQFAFKPLGRTAFTSLLHHPAAKLIGFFTVIGLGVYTFFVARIMGLVNNTQVVPDRVQQALDTLAEGLLVLDEDEKIVLANRAFAETVRKPQDELQGLTASELPWVQTDELEEEGVPWKKSIDSCESTTDHNLLYQINPGSQRIFSINSAPIIAPDGSHRGALATFRDVTQVEAHREQLENMLAVMKSNRDEITRKNQELEILATQDSLTGCLNRRAFFERFEQEWAKAQNEGMPLSCIMVDNDHFKSVNDNYGHHIGDEVLRNVAGILKNLNKDHGYVCRYGGEEFCVLLPGKSLEQAARQAEVIRQEIEVVRFDEPADLRLTASLGVSDLRFEAKTPQDLINQADVCLYVAKRSGRNQVVSYEPSMEEMEVDESAVSRTKEEETTPEIPFQAVTALVSALAYRDADTAEHSRRVADLCVIAADGLLDHKKTYILEIAALLHDIGKIGVPDNVLLKPGPLTSEEWKLMGRHDRIGVEIVAGTFNCAELAEIIRTHHAFFGGKGRNPHLPQGADIPVEARLLSIADGYDAMTSDRIYRKGRSHEEAVAELRRCSGSQFDPDLVEHFTKAIDQYKRQRSENKLTVSKQTAIQIGLQIERLAEAVDMHDSEGLSAIASRLGAVAQRGGVVRVAQAAEQLEQEAMKEDAEWMDMLELTQTLLELCRSTQNDCLQEGDSIKQTLKSDPNHSVPS